MPDRQRYLGGRERQGERQRYLGARARSDQRTRYKGVQAAGKPAEKHPGLLHRFGADLYHAAVNTPAGLYYTGKAVVAPAYEDIRHGPNSPQAQKARAQQVGLATNIVKATAHDFRHPGDHPGYTALDALGVASLGAGTAARVGALGRLAREGGTLADAGRILRHGPPPATRTYKVGELKVEAPASRAASTRAAQRAIDKAEQRSAAKNPTGFGARRQIKKAGKALEEQLRHEEALAKAPAGELVAMARRLKPEERMALRLHAEEAPVEGRIQALQNRIANSKGAERRRHQKRLDLTVKARLLLDETGGRPVVATPKLQKVYAQMEKVARGREDIGKQLGLLTDESIQTRKTSAGRVALGATYEKPTPGKLGQSPALERAVARRDRLQKEWDRLAPKYRRGYTESSRAKTEAEARRELATLEKRHETFMEKAYRTMFAEKLTPADLAEQRARNQLKGKFNKQQSGRTRTGRLSGAAGADKVQRIPKTIKEEYQQMVEDRVDRMLAKSNHPSAKRMVAERARITELRDALQPLPGEKVDVGKLGKVVSAKYESMSPRLHRLGGALSYANDEVQRLQARAAARVKPTGIIGQEQFKASPNAVYVPDVGTKGGASGRLASVGAQGTVGHPLSPFKAGYTGGAKRAGREPLNTTKAVAQSNLAATRFVRLLGLRQKLEKAATPEPRFKNDIAVRLDNIGAHERLPAQAREFLENPRELTPDEGARMFEKLRKSIILAPEDAAEFQRLHEQGKIGYVPAKLLGDLAKPATPLSSGIGKVPTAILDAINNAERVGILYTKPAYAVPNALGNLALTLIQQGFAAPRNIAFASRMHWQLGAEATSRIDTLVGEGVVAALESEQGLGAVATQKMAHIWSRGVDRPFRRAAFAYEAKVAGYRSPTQIHDLLYNPAKHSDLMNVVKRANRSLIDYGRLSSRERQYVRRLIFFYPWVKGSTLYAGHFLAEHPVKAAVAGQVARYGQQKADQSTGEKPSYLEGTFQAGGGLVNPTSAAIFQTPAQALSAAASVFPGGPNNRASLPANLMTPGLELAIAEATRINPQTGHQYRPGEGIARDTLVRGLPAYQLYEGLHGRSTSKLYEDNKRSAMLKFLVGGLAPRPYNKGYLHTLAGKEKSGR